MTMKKIIILFHLTLHVFSIFIKVGNSTDNASIFYSNIYDALNDQKYIEPITLFLQDNTFLDKNLEILDKSIEIS